MTGFDPAAFRAGLRRESYRQPDTRSTAMTGEAPYTPAAIDALTEAVDSEHDFGGWLSLVLVRVAARKGSLDALTDGRPGSWEAALVDRLARGLAFDDAGLQPYAEVREDDGHE